MTSSLSFSTYLMAVLFFLSATISSCQKEQDRSVVESADAKTTPQLVSQTSNNPQFSQPINCSLGKDCFIGIYFDRDSSKNYQDFACGTQSYDGHTGTDFGIPDQKVMARGVEVKASAPGKVLKVRDGVPDKRVENEAEAEAISHIGCGNLVLIDHGQGWRSLYCHLRKGSVKVKSDMQVERGTVLGLVGNSGLASFPHVHLEILYQGKAIDPFVGVNNTSGCQVQRQPLWKEPINYVATGLVRAGFASEAPNESSVWAGKYQDNVLNKDIPLLVFWVHNYGVLKDDVASFKLTDPNGKVVAEGDRTLTKPNRLNSINFVGKKNTPAKPIIPGIWRGEFQLKRAGKVLVNVKKEVTIK